MSEPEFPTSVHAQLAHLAAAFCKRASAEADDLDALAERLATENAAEARNEIRRIAHRMAGTAGTFGFLHLSEVAARLEDLTLSGASDTELRAPTRAAAAEARRVG